MLERDPPMPPCSDVTQADGAAYKATQRARNGSPQFLFGHIFLNRSWEVSAGRWDVVLEHIVWKCWS